MDREAAEAFIKAEGLEVATDKIEIDGHMLMVKSNLQPVCHDESDPLFLTMVFGDRVLGMQELPTYSETECRQLHRSIVDRYVLEEAARREGTARVLVEGVL